MARDAREGSESDEKKPKSRRPANTAFRQQRLKAWQPILTPKTVLPLFFVVGVIFAPLGGLMLYASSQVQELVIDYTNCLADAPSSNANPPDLSKAADIPSGNYELTFQSSTSSGQNPSWVTWSQNITYYRGQPVNTNTTSLPSGAQPHNVTTTMCTLLFNIPDDIGFPNSPVLLYYRLTNFYQNHRRYVKSFDSSQLQGQALDAGTINNSACDPLTSNNSRPYYPCGVVANSQFNDTFSSPIALNAPGASEPITYPMTNIGIAWSSDKALYSATSAYTNASIAVPPYWMARWANGVYTDSNPPPNLNTYEEFQVWMRTAGLPDFSKLALRNDNQTMKAGRYRLDIGLNFPVTEYSGTKSVVITTSTVIGGKNPFLGIAYVVVAGICVLLGLAFTAAQLIKPRKLGDHAHLTWNNEQSSSGATSTGVQRPGAGDGNAS